MNTKGELRPPTYVSAYYHIPKRSMPHMGISRYLRLAPVTLQMISGSKLIFFYEEDCIGRVVDKMCKDWRIELVLKRVTIKELPQRQAAVQIAANADHSSLPPEDESAKEKGWSHLKGMVHGEDRTEYEDNLSIWLSKIDLVNSASPQVESSDSPIAWVDFGISKVNYMRSNWDFRKLSLEQTRSQISHYASSMRFRQRQLPLSAGFLLGSNHVWAILKQEFLNQLVKAQSDSYPHDEETILAGVVKKRPELFHLIGRPYSGSIGKVRYLAERLRGHVN